MSLINDALKRASRAQPPPPAGAEPEPPLRPAEYPARSVWVIAAPVALLIVLALAGWFFFKGWQAEHASLSPVTPIPVLARELPADSRNSIPAISPLTIPTAPPSNNAQPAASLMVSSHRSEPTPGASIIPTPRTNEQVAAIEPPKPTFPVVRLQGIFFRAKNPSVMINAKTISVGDKIANVKVVAIRRDSVTLEWNGETKVLTME